MITLERIKELEWKGLHNLEASEVRELLEFAKKGFELVGIGLNPSNLCSGDFHPCTCGSLTSVVYKEEKE